MDPFENGGFIAFQLVCNILAKPCNIATIYATFCNISWKMFSAVFWPCESVSGIIGPLSPMHFNLRAVMCVLAICRKYF